MYVGECTYVCIGGYTSVCVRRWVYICVRMCVHLCVHRCVCVYFVCVSGCTSVYAGGCTSAYVGGCVFVYVSGCTSVCIDGCVLVYNIAILEVGVGTSRMLRVLKSGFIQLVPPSPTHTGVHCNMTAVASPFLCCYVLSIVLKIIVVSMEITMVTDVPLLLFIRLKFFDKIISMATSRKLLFSWKPDLLTYY